MAHNKDAKEPEEGTMHQNSRDAGALHPGQRWLEILVQGHLDSQWSDWFDGMALSPTDNGQTILAGYVADQAALMGILTKLNRLNLTLVSINEVKKDRPLKEAKHGTST